MWSKRMRPPPPEWSLPCACSNQRYPLPTTCPPTHHIQMASGARFGEFWLRESLSSHTSQLISMCQRLMSNNGKALTRSILVRWVALEHWSTGAFVEALEIVVSISCVARILPHFAGKFDSFTKAQRDGPVHQVGSSSSCCCCCCSCFRCWHCRPCRSWYCSRCCCVCGCICTSL